MIPLPVLVLICATSLLVAVAILYKLARGNRPMQKALHRDRRIGTTLSNGEVFFYPRGCSEIFDELFCGCDGEVADVERFFRARFIASQGMTATQLTHVYGCYFLVNDWFVSASVSDRVEITWTLLTGKMTSAYARIKPDKSLRLRAEFEKSAACVETDLTLPFVGPELLSKCKKLLGERLPELSPWLKVSAMLALCGGMPIGTKCFLSLQRRLDADEGFRIGLWEVIRTLENVDQAAPVLC